MGQWAEVTLLVRKTYAVELEANETAEDAERYALEDHIGGHAEVRSSLLAKDETEADSIRRHADEELAL